MGQPTNASIEKNRSKLDNIGYSTKTKDTTFPEGKKIGYESAIMMAGEHQNRVTVTYSTCTFTKPTKPETYNPIIKISIEEVTKPHKEASWKSQQDEQEFNLGIKYVCKEKTLESYERLWPEEIG